MGWMAPLLAALGPAAATATPGLLGGAATGAALVPELAMGGMLSSGLGAGAGVTSGGLLGNALWQAAPALAGGASAFGKAAQAGALAKGLLGDDERPMPSLLPPPGGPLQQPPADTSPFAGIYGSPMTDEERKRLMMMMQQGARYG